MKERVSGTSQFREGFDNVGPIGATSAFCSAPKWVVDALFYCLNLSQTDPAIPRARFRWWFLQSDCAMRIIPRMGVGCQVSGAGCMFLESRRSLADLGVFAVNGCRVSEIFLCAGVP